MNHYRRLLFIATQLDNHVSAALWARTVYGNPAWGHFVLHDSTITVSDSNSRAEGRGLGCWGFGCRNNTGEPKHQIGVSGVAVDPKNYMLQVNRVTQHALKANLEVTRTVSRNTLLYCRLQSVTPLIAAETIAVGIAEMRMAKPSPIDSKNGTFFRVTV